MSDIPDTLKSILELARWAPSGDNLQPWRFEIVGEDRLRLHIRRENDVYDFGGAATWTTSGVMLETLRIAASNQGRGMTWVLAFEDADALKFEIDFPHIPALIEDPLVAWIKQRSVNRGPYQMHALTQAEKQALQSAVGPGFQIRWFETFAEKWAITRLNARATWLRLTLPETFAIHQRIIDWDNDLSPDRVPSTAVGLDPLTRRLMRWALGDWKRANFLNRYFGGPLTPVIEMDVLPGLRCAAHFAFTCPQLHTTRDETFIAVGQALQRFWLTATSLGLVMQPTFATIAFAYYGEGASAFSSVSGAANKAKTIAHQFDAIFGFGSEQTPFLGRIGRPLGASLRPRSVRLELHDLLYR